MDFMLFTLNQAYECKTLRNFSYLFILLAIKKNHIKFVNIKSNAYR